VADDPGRDGGHALAAAQGSELLVGDGLEGVGRAVTAAAQIGQGLDRQVGDAVLGGAGQVHLALGDLDGGGVDDA
jgi:hypothetical protein